MWMHAHDEALHVDEKEQAARTIADVIRATENNFPDPAYRPMLLRDSVLNRQNSVSHGPKHVVRANNDGIGTKPELAERLFTETGDYRFFETLAFDGIAMVVDDAARYGQFVVGVSNNLDVNSAEDGAFIAALSRGALHACNRGGFPLLDGETAELGYRTAGYGRNRVNWNFTALTLVNREKMIDGSGLRPGQPIVVLRESSIRSNGLTRARAILENAYRQEMHLEGTRLDAIAELTRAKIGHVDLDIDTIKAVLKNTPAGPDLEESIPLAWHKMFQEETTGLLVPSTIYLPLIYAAQGGVDGEVRVPIVAAAHISGGGVPLKGKRMVEGKGLGLSMEKVFPDPQIVTSLMELAENYPHPEKGQLVNNRSASEQWNRGVGFMCAVEDEAKARDLIELATQLGYEAAIGGKVTDQKVIDWCGERWSY